MIVVNDGDNIKFPGLVIDNMINDIIANTSIIINNDRSNLCLKRIVISMIAFNQNNEISHLAMNLFRILKDFSNI